MLSLFIFKSNSRGMNYGIGTYLKQLSVSLLENYNVSITFIYFLSSNKEYEILKTSEKLTEIHIPSSIFQYGSVRQEQKYAKRVVDLISPTISNSENVLFQVNQLDTLPIVKVLKTKYHFPIVSVIHSAQWQSLYDGNKQKFNNEWFNENNSHNIKLKPLEYERELYELSDKIISVTNYMKKFIVDYYNIPENKVEIIKNGIDNFDFHIPGETEKASIKQELGFKNDDKIVLFSGRLDSSKGLYYLIDAFAQVVTKYDKIRLVIVGEDSGPDKISQFLTHCSNFLEKVTFTGFLQYKDVLKFYQIADVGIVPSIYDHCPYVALEMIGHNIPMVISDIEGLSEILSERQSLYIKPLTNNNGDLYFKPSDISDAILTLINSKVTAKRISKDYMHLIETKYSSRQMAKNMYSVLLKLVAVQ